MEKENVQIENKITYNEYTVISVRKLNKIIFVKTYNRFSGEIFWFLGFAINLDLIEDIKRILRENKNYSNEFFKQMFCASSIHNKDTKKKTRIA